MNLNFGQAIQALKDGKRVSRMSWQDFDLFIFRQVPAEINEEIIPKMQSLPQSVKVEFEKRGGSIHYHNQLALVTADNRISGWAPSPADVLANDWCILDVETPETISTDDPKAEYNVGNH